MEPSRRCQQKPLSQARERNLQKSDTCHFPLSFGWKMSLASSIFNVRGSLAEKITPGKVIGNRSCCQTPPSPPSPLRGSSSTALALPGMILHRGAATAPQAGFLLSGGFGVQEPILSLLCPLQFLPKNNQFVSGAGREQNRVFASLCVFGRPEPNPDGILLTRNGAGSSLCKSFSRTTGSCQELGENRTGFLPLLVYL